MEPTQLQVLYKTFDATRRENGVEYWYARDLYPLLGYTKWENFETALERGREACKKAGGNVDHHFLGVRKMIKVGKGAEMEIFDYKD